jgi:hypothetical protein
MSILRLIGVAAVAVGCAGAGIPASDDPAAGIAIAERAIADAQAAGADSLAAGPMRDARAGLEAARAALSDDGDRAAILAAKARADAVYAQSVARRTLAERQRAAAQAELERVPPPGAAR